jgi:hypothetical protein
VSPPEEKVSGDCWPTIESIEQSQLNFRPHKDVSMERRAAWAPSLPADSVGGLGDCAGHFNSVVHV